MAPACAIQAWWSRCSGTARAPTRRRRCNSSPPTQTPRSAALRSRRWGARPRVVRPLRGRAGPSPGGDPCRRRPRVGAGHARSDDGARTSAAAAAIPHDHGDRVLQRGSRRRRAGVPDATTRARHEDAGVSSRRVRRRSGSGTRFSRVWPDAVERLLPDWERGMGTDLRSAEQRALCCSRGGSLGSLEGCSSGGSRRRRREILLLPRLQQQSQNLLGFFAERSDLFGFQRRVLAIYSEPASRILNA